MNMILHIMSKPMPGVRQIALKIIQERSSLLPRSRQNLLRRAREAGVDYALCIDTDQEFPSNLLYGLLRHWKPIVACNIATKSVPASPTARNFNPNWAGGDCVFTDRDSHGLEKVWRIGFGIILIDLSILKSIPLPWFNVEWDEGIQDHIGEDWFFCRLMEKHGHEIFIDQDLSWQIGHVGPMVYTHELVGEVVKQEDAAIKEAAKNGLITPHAIGPFKGAPTWP